MSALFGDWPTWQIRLGSFEVESPTTPKRRENHRGEGVYSGHVPVLHTTEEAYRAASPPGPLKKCWGAVH